MQALVHCCSQADSAAYQAEKQLKEFGDKVPADVKEKVEAKVKALREAIASDKTEDMKTAMEQLQQEIMSLGQVSVAVGFSMYTVGCQYRLPSWECATLC